MMLAACEEDTTFVEGRVTTDPAAEVTKSTVTLSGKLEITSHGSDAKGMFGARGFVITPNRSNIPTAEAVRDSIYQIEYGYRGERELPLVLAEGKGEGVFSVMVLGLRPNTTYYARSICVATTTGYQYAHSVFMGNTIEFQTLNGNAPPEAATAEIDVSGGVVTLHGSVEYEGNPPYTERGFVAAATAAPTLNTPNVVKITAAGTGEGSYSAFLTSAPQGSRIYVRAYAVNTAGVAYGTEFNFTIEPPVVATNNATNINTTAGTATLNGSITSTGDLPITERGFVYGTMSNPTITNGTKVTVSGTGTGNFSKNITGLEEDNTYYVRAYAATSKDTTYGNAVAIGVNYVVFASGSIMVQIYDNSAGTHWTSANTICDNLTTGGYNDWRLPTRGELEAMYDNRDAIGNFQTSATGVTYWSGTAYYSTYKYVTVFNTNTRSSDYWSTSTSYSFRVRCVRSLP